MTANQHPITPPPELVQQWANTSASAYRENGTYEQHEFALATQAARWGADQELEACCAWIPEQTPWDADKLRATRRPKPPSLKEQALAKLPEHPENMAGHWKLTPGAVALIRRALEALPND